MFRHFRARLVVEHYPAINSAVALTAALYVRYESRERVFTAGN